MSYYEYRVVPAPTEAPKTRGIKGVAARFSAGLEEALNVEGRDAWEFQRSETLTVSAKQGLFRKTVTESVTVMIYRRWVDTVDAAPLQDTNAYWNAPQDAPRDEPQTPEMLASDLQQTEGDASPRASKRLSAQRQPEGELRPVPGAARD